MIDALKFKNLNKKEQKRIKLLKIESSLIMAMVIMGNVKEEGDTDLYLAEQKIKETLFWLKEQQNWEMVRDEPDE